MALFTKEQIEGIKTYLQQKDYPEVSVDLGKKRKFNYFLVSQNENPNLPDFAMAMRTRNLGEGTLFGISDSVPEDFRKYWAGHEFMETVELEPGTPNKCLITLEKELLLVPEHIKPSYIPRRLEFFRGLITYAQTSNYATEDIDNFRQSLSKLEILARQLALL